MAVDTAKEKDFKMARIALAVGLGIAGAVVGVLPGGLGAFPVGAWAADIFAGFGAGFSAGNARGGLFVGQMEKEEDDEITTTRN
jgi:hypothetical protein